MEGRASNKAKKKKSNETIIKKRNKYVFSKNVNAITFLLTWDKLEIKAVNGVFNAAAFYAKTQIPSHFVTRF